MKYIITLILISLVTIGNGQTRVDNEIDTVLNHHIMGSVYFTLPGIYQCSCCSKEFNLHDLMYTPCEKKCYNPFDLIRQDTDTLTAERFIQDSLGNNYEIEYRYANEPDSVRYFLGIIQHGQPKLHEHHVALVNILKYRGNKQTIIGSNIKAIYSPNECSSDNTKLWLKRVYEYSAHQHK